MAKSKKKTTKKKVAKKKKVKKTIPIEELEFPDLVDVVKRRGSANKVEINRAYNEIQKRMKLKIGYLVNKFFIPGHTSDDILQEALMALRYNAIPDFNRHKKGRDGNPYAFDKFANLCIRRHLSTLLKRSYQLKRKTLDMSLSLDQDRNDSSSDSLFLIDIIASTEGDILEELGQNEYYKFLFNKLYAKLSKFEKKVFLLYRQKYSYVEITDIINKNLKKEGKSRKSMVEVKSVDNALSRLKQKAKEIYRKYGEDD